MLFDYLQQLTLLNFEWKNFKKNELIKRLYIRHQVEASDEPKNYHKYLM